MRPNIVLLTCHDIGRHLGCYGVDTVHTPNLDALAADGIRFDRAFSTSCGCSPSRASIATGRYPHNHGVMGLTHPPFAWDLNPGERPIATILHGAGYATHLFGFQHVSPTAAKLGFDGVHCNGHGECCNVALGCKVTDEVDEFLAVPQGEKPYYLEINLEEPHRPYDQGGARPDDSAGVFVPHYLPDAPESREEMAALQGAIRQADDSIGRIRHSLTEAGILDNAIFVFVADHGIAMPRAKCTLYDPGTEIAFLLTWPSGTVPRSESRSELVSNIDILPTLLNFAGVAVPPFVQGQSLRECILGNRNAPRSEVYCEKTWHTYYDPMRSIRTEHFKLIQNFETAPAVEIPGDVERGSIFRAFVDRYHSSTHDPSELYDLRLDPWEQNNLAGQPEYAETEASLMSRLWTWMRSSDDPILQGPIPSPAFRSALAAGAHPESD